MSILSSWHIQPPSLLRELIPEASWRMRENANTVYLTFDDGPIPEVTPAVCEILNDFQAKATFFCVGDNVRKYPEVFQQVVDAGHAIGNHTMHHIHGWKTSCNDYLDDIQQCQFHISQQIIPPPKLFRPPFGKLTPQQYFKIKKEYQIVMWDVLSRDWEEHLSSEQIIRNVCDHVRDGSIIVFHDSWKAWSRLEKALPRICKEFQNRGLLMRSLPIFQPFA